jgi:hypothetical protein
MTIRGKVELGGGEFRSTWVRVTLRGREWSSPNKEMQDLLRELQEVNEALLRQSDQGPYRPNLELYYFDEMARVVGIVLVGRRPKIKAQRGPRFGKDGGVD